MSSNFDNEMIEDNARLQRMKLQSRFNAIMDTGDLPPLPPLPPKLERSEVFRGRPKKGFGDEEELIEERVLCSWGPAEWQEKGIVNLQSGILKKIEFVNGKKYYYVDVDFKDYAGKIVEGAERIMDFPAEHVTIEATENIVYPSTRDSSGHITENESGLEQEKREREKREEEQRESLEKWRERAAKERGWRLTDTGEYIGPQLPLSKDRGGGKKRKTYKKHKKTQYKKYKKTKKHRKTRR